jgi:hypothetical protein
MAGRPASRGSGLTGLHYGLFTFVFVSVVLLGVTIFLLTQISSYEQTAVDAQADMDLYGRPASYYIDEARALNTSAFNVVNQHLEGYGQLVLGDSEALYATARSRIERTLDSVAAAHAGSVNRGSALLRTTQRLSDLLSDERTRAASLAARVQNLEAQNASLTNQIESVSGDFQTQVAALREDYRTTEQRYNQALAEKDRQREELESGLERATRQLQDLRVQIAEGDEVKDVEITRLENLVEELREKIAAFEDPGLDPEAILTKADGQVLRAVPGSDVVYINLGSKDGLKVGMPFEVFSRTEAPRGIRGKASIEVATVLYETAECLVTRSISSRPVIEGDPIVNIAYEPNRKPRFVVRGEFDLDYNGTPDGGEGRRQVESLIDQWGGVVVNELDEQTDFVVVGTAPFIPNVGDRPLTPTTVAQIEKQRLARSEFQDLIERARGMFVPVITQSQFLFLIGSPQEELIRPMPR